MKQNHIPSYQYPTETVLIDDNKNFLKTLKAALGYQYQCQIFSDPEQALTYISGSTEQFKTAISRYVPAAEDVDDHKKGINIDFADVHKEIYNKDRFREIAVVIIDYGMPTLNGIEVAKNIRKTTHSPIKIIMLTGEADYQIAVQAFNDNLIDKFIMKSQANYIAELVEAISVLQKKYFYDLSEPIRLSLQPVAQKLAEDPEFISIFSSIQSENKMKEFYILEDSFSVLFLDEKGENPLRLIIKTEDDMNMQFELAQDDKKVSTEILDALKNRKKLAYFQDKSSINLSAQHWKLHEAKPLGNEKNRCYYAIIQGQEIFKLDKEKLISYQSYLKSK